GSTNSERMPFVGGSVYALTKGAVAGFTKGLARDLGPRGITVNNVQPGPIDTNMNPADSDFAKTLVPITALQRYGNTDEIASFVSFLASPDASYITGASLLADGGFAELKFENGKQESSTIKRTETMNIINSKLLLGQLNWRYATKQFDPNRKISDQDWATIEQALLLTPSSGGLQPWKFIVVTDPALRAKLLPASYG